jgi:uncharacterized protein with NRDE domain
MCTVSFVYSNNKIIITSNRDEQVIRPALEPKNYQINQKQVFFPKDPKAGGTWFAVDEHSNVIVLLNGASEKHQWNPPYRKSRGLIVLDIIGETSPKLKWETISLENIEPFTIVLYHQNELFQLRWDGVEKESVKLNLQENYIWSSSTLYPKNIRETRAHWFAKFLSTKREINENELFHFHRYTEDANKENGLVINRNNLLQTLSITQTVIEKNKVVVRYHDLLGSKETSQSFLIV